MPNLPILFDIVHCLECYTQQSFENRLCFRLQLENEEHNPKSVLKRQFLPLVTSSTFGGKQVQFPSSCVMKTEMLDSAQNIMK